MSDIRELIDAEVVQAEACEALRAAILAQNESDRYDAPYVSEEISSAGFVQVDGQLALAPLAAAVISAISPVVRADLAKRLRAAGDEYVGSESDGLEEAARIVEGTA